MRKKGISFLLGIVSVAASAFGMASCEEKHEHAYKEEVVAPTCEERGYTLHECDCGEKYETDYVAALDHEFGAYESDGNATYTSDGTKTAHCTREGCEKTDTVADDGSKLKSYVSFNTLTQTGESEYKAVVSNASETFSFVEEVEKIGLAEYVVTTDEYGIQQVLTKIAPLNPGDNTFYVFETIDGKVTNTYKTTIRRRPKYTVTFDAKGGTAVENQTVEEGFFASDSESITTRAGYTFDKWDFDFATPITGNVTISAKWNANTNTAYKVEYYLQNLENDEYTLQSAATENKTGTTDTTASAEVKTFAHFTYKQGATESGNISGDGSTVLKVYYARNRYTVTFDGNGGTLQSGNATQEVKYGGSVVAPTYTRGGYTFDGWNKEIPAMPAENVTITAKWQAVFTVSGGTVTGLTDCGKTLSKIEIPDEIDGVAITAVGERAFYDCNNLTSVTIGSNVTSIGDSAFYDCNNLTSVTIGSNVTSIGDSAINSERDFRKTQQKIPNKIENSLQMIA